MFYFEEQSSRSSCLHKIPAINQFTRQKVVRMAKFMLEKERKWKKDCFRTNQELVLRLRTKLSIECQKRETSHKQIYDGLIILKWIVANLRCECASGHARREDVCQTIEIASSAEFPFGRKNNKK